MEASRTPRPDGANTTSTATIAPTAEAPPRNGIDLNGGSATERTMNQKPTPPSTQVPQ